MATVKKTDNSKQSIIVQNITIRPVVRSSQDIEKWRNALRAAEAITPIRIQLYDLYEDIFLDTVLSSIIEKRVLGVTKTKLVFTDKNGKENEEITQLIANSEFRKLRKELQLQKMWGIKVIELQKINDQFVCYSVPNKHIRPDLGKIVFEQYGIEGIDYKMPPNDKFIVEIGNRYDLGLLLKAAPYVIYKRGGFGDWAHFAEIFGMPFREARYDGYNQEVKFQLEQALEQAGSAPYVVLPKEAEITFHDSKGTVGSNELYNSLRRACNEELSILILGQTETTTSSQTSGYAQSQTHAQVEDAINHNDQIDELSLLNEKIKPILANLGYPVGDGSFVHIPEKENLSQKDRVVVIDTLKNKVGLPMDDDALYEEFGVKKPTDYAEQKSKKEVQQQQQLDAAQQPDNTPLGTKKDTKKSKPSTATSDEEGKLSAFDSWRLKLADFFAQAPKS